MIACAWQWAQKTNNLRKNEIHQEEEARLLLTDNFELIDEEGQEVTMSGTIEMEDDTGFLLTNELPCQSSSAADIVARNVPTSSGTGNPGAGNQPVQDSLSTTASFKKLIMKLVYSFVGLLC
ncbi:unnamed protein product [Symbiodinium pilosum]|uniref:Uncharacterized protein n=1 Tax=Symbiodinium pilosum TaxID=2952 RepID=A0A812Y1L5_SYMPI|nr:unnamed protein product [Symbiodinium pilosum]